ncbi:MAG TPA: hypothetical protein VIQ29_19465 [Ancylobacter sp.]
MSANPLDSADANGAFAQLEMLVQKTNIAGKSGKLLYSSRTTLSPGELYVLGFNPGGDPNVENETVAENIAATPQSGWNEYTHGIWKLRDKVYPAGEQPRQRRIRSFFDVAGYDITAAFCSNVFFMRGIDVQRSVKTTDFSVLANECAFLHRFMLDVVRPRIVVCFGHDAFRWFEKLNLSLRKDVHVEQVPHFARGSNEAFFAAAAKLRSLL